jgi:uncharacterized protein (TIGR03437 family)
MLRLLVTLPGSAVLLFVAIATMLALLPGRLPAQEALEVREIFAGDAPFRAVSYAFPESLGIRTLPPLCALARDLPLIAESGANVVLTEGMPSLESDPIFLNLLASTGLAWVASFPLPEDVDRGIPLLNQKELLLARFAEFAARFAGNPNLRGVMVDFGSEHTSVAVQLTNDFAALLEAYFPARPPRLGLVASSPAGLDGTPAGVGFWIYRFSGASPSLLNRIQLEMRTTLPIVFDLSGVARSALAAGGGNSGAAGTAWQAYLRAFSSNDPLIRMVALRFVAERGTGSGNETIESALFRTQLDGDGFENLHPTVLTEAQRELWGAQRMGSYTSRPGIDEIRNSATQTDFFSPGTRMEVEGSLFGEVEESVASPHWPLHAGAVCLCVGQRPVPIGALGASRILAQLPWLLSTGTAELRVVREGVASAPRIVDLFDYSPGIFGDTLLYKETPCGLMESSGLSAGDTFDLYVTGAGSLNGHTGDLQLSLDGTPLDLLYVGLESSEPGLALIRARVRAKAGNNGTQGLRLRRGTRMSNVLPISYAAQIRPGIALTTATSVVNVQPKGIGAQVKIQTKGLNGFCGGVDFEVLGLPPGVKASADSAMSGQESILQLWADGTALPVQGHSFYLYAFPLGGDPQMLTMRLNVLPSTGPVLLSVESAGFAAGSKARMEWNGESLYSTAPEDARGLYMLLVNGVTGAFGAVERYDLWASAEESQRLETRLQGLPAGMIVAMAIADEATFEMQPSLRALIQEKLGSQAIASLGYQHSWAIISKVGVTEPLAEASSAHAAVRVQATLELPR